MAEERFQLSVINKASSISHLVHGVTLGPDSPRSSSISSMMTTPFTPKSEIPKHAKKSKPLETTDRQKMLRRESAGVVEKLLYELEQQRKAEVQEGMRMLLEKLELKSKENEREVCMKQANLKCEAEDRAYIERQKAQRLQQELEFQENQRQVNLALAQQKRAQERQQLIQVANQQAEELRKHNEIRKNQIDKIKQYEQSFYVYYQQLLDCISLCQDKEALQAACASNLQMVRSLQAALIQLVHQCSVGEVSSLDLQTASAINNQLDNNYKQIQETATKINEKCDENSAIEKQLKQKQELEKNAAIAVPTTVLASTAPEQSTSNLLEAEYHQIYYKNKEFLEAFKISVSELTLDQRYKEFSFKCKKAVNIPVNAISDVSGPHLHDKLKRLTFLLLGETVDLEGSRFSAKAHPQGLSFCMNLLARKMVSQGRTSVSSKREAAFPMAAIIVALWAEFPEFGKLFLAHLYTACPYLVPAYLCQMEGQSDEDFYKMLGYSYDDDGKVEKHDKFLKKTSGIMQLYAAIMITPVRSQLRRPHPHGLWHAWRWLSSIVNLEPHRDITATLLLSFLEVTGSALGATYGIQFQKLLHLICKDFYPRIKNIDGQGGPVVRLEVFLQGLLKRGGIPRPQGMLPANFW